MTEKPLEDSKKPARFDENDGIYYMGLLLVGIGVGFGYSWQTALIVVGGILTVVSVVNSYLLAWFSRQ